MSALSGDWPAGLSTTQFPAASAGATFQHAIGKWKIPRHDRRNDAHRLAQREIKSAARDRNRLPAKFRHGPGVVFENARAERHFIARVADGFADVARFHLRDGLQRAAESCGQS